VGTAVDGDGLGDDDPVLEDVPEGLGDADGLVDGEVVGD
jgi:hypothetical protein